MALPEKCLVAPTILDAGGISPAELPTARQDPSARAGTNKLCGTEKTGGSYTVSNLGLTRVHHFTTMFNTPQIGILWIGHIEERACKSADRRIDWRPMMGLSLTFDRRAIVGGTAADLLTDLCETIESLGSILNHFMQFCLSDRCKVLAETEKDRPESIRAGIAKPIAPAARTRSSLGLCRA